MSKILYVVESSNNWVNYAADLVELARDNSASVHVLDTSVLLGMEIFTAEPLEEKPLGAETADGDIADLATAPIPEDIKDSIRAERRKLSDILEYLASANIESEGHARPAMQGQEIAAYAQSVNADILAHSELGFWDNLMRDHQLKRFEDSDFKVVQLKSSV